MHIVIFDFVNEMSRIWTVTLLQGNAIRRLSVWRRASQVWTFAANRIETPNPVLQLFFSKTSISESLGGQ